MYRAPNTSISNLPFVLGNLTSEIVYIRGDYNIDLLQCEEQAESKYFLDQMFSPALYPLITRQTRITGTTAAIIDNILCSVHEDPTVKYKRTFDEDLLNRPDRDLYDINWETVWNESYPNSPFSRFMHTQSNTYNDACPVKITKYVGKTIWTDKPWLTRGLKNACIKKNNLYLAFIKDTSEFTESRHKRYKNKLTKLVHLEKKNYYRKKLEDCKTNTRETWKILINIIGKIKSETKYSNEFRVGENRVELESKREPFQQILC